MKIKSFSFLQAIWLPSVGALQLSESSILKRRDSLKKRKKAKNAVCESKQRPAKSQKTIIRHQGCNVDPKTLAWVESGLEKFRENEKVRDNILLKWDAFLQQHLMQDFSRVRIHFINFYCINNLSTYSVYKQN